MRLTTANQINLWGKGGMEPQRIDLWHLDFTNAVNAMNTLDFGGVAPRRIEPIFPQFVQSISLPEVRLKADVFRRESIPYQMPSWDDPLDPIKITFLLDTIGSDVATSGNASPISSTQLFLMRWMQLVRAGRGERSSLYQPPTSALRETLLLNDNFTMPYRFDVHLFLVRGKTNRGNSVVSPQLLAQQNAIDQNARQQQQQLRNALQLPDLQASASRSSPATPLVLPTSAFCELDAWQRVGLQQLWLAGFKLSDLSYAQNGLATIDATFYAESVDITTV